MKRSKNLGTRRGFRPFGLPTWAIALAVLVVVAAAGAAVGPVLNGNLNGEVGLTVEQSVVLGEGSTITDHLGDNSLVVTNDEGTSFTAAIEMHVGDENWSLNLDVDNLSDATANALLQFNIPAGVDVEVEPSGSIDEAQMDRNTWLVEVPSGTANGELEITIETRDNFRPGFTSLAGRIIQIEG